MQFVHIVHGSPNAVTSLSFYSFRDDFNYPSIQNMTSSGWTICGGGALQWDQPQLNPDSTNPSLATSNQQYTHHDHHIGTRPTPSPSRTPAYSGRNRWAGCDHRYRIPRDTAPPPRNGMKKQNRLEPRITYLAREIVHGQESPPTSQQNPLGQAVSHATTMGLILSIPQSQPTETCPVCHNQQPAGGKFCMHCGIRLRCLFCGASSLGKNYCHECGKPLKQ